MEIQEATQNIQEKKSDIFRFEDYKDKFKKIEEDIKFNFTYKDYLREIRNKRHKRIKNISKFTLYSIVATIVVGIFNEISSEQGLGAIIVLGIILFGIWCIYAIYILITALYGYMISNEESYNLILNERIINEIIFEYKSRLPIINYMPDDIQYSVIEMLEVTGSSYDDAKNILIFRAYDVEADAIVNLQHQISNKTSTSATTSISGRTATTSVNTSTSETHYLKGIAIKIL